MSRKTFIGRVLSVTNSKVIMSTTDPAHGDAIALQAGAVVLEQARQLRGRVVRFVAEVSSETKCLSNPQFVIGSEFGLQAVPFPQALDHPRTHEDQRRYLNGDRDWSGLAVYPQDCE